MNETVIALICSSVTYIFTLFAIVYSMCYLLSEKRIGNPATLKFAVSLLVVIAGTFLVLNKIDATPLWGIFGSLVTLAFLRNNSQPTPQNRNQSTTQQPNEHSESSQSTEEKNS